MPMKLTAEQEDAVMCPADYHLLVLAGPGTGKTEVVARRLNYLLSGQEKLKPSEILTLSFSRSAVRALVQRIRRLEGSDVSTVESLRHLSVRTFDSWSFRALRFLGFAPEDLLRGTYDDNIQRLIDMLSKTGPDDILEHPRLGLLRLRHLVVDECQDLTGLRACLVKVLLARLAQSRNNDRTAGFTLLGDPNQAIYDWNRGDSDSIHSISSLELLRWVRSEFADTLLECTLLTNHRSTPEYAAVIRKAADILRMAAQELSDPRPPLENLISGIASREALVEFRDFIANSLNGRTLAILGRGNSDVLDIAIRLRKDLPPELAAKVRVTTGNRTKMLPPWIASLLAEFKGLELTKSNFERLFEHNRELATWPLPCGGDAISCWLLLMDCAKRSETDQAITMLDLRRRISWPDSLPDDEIEDDDEIILSTIHRAKGLEYDLIGMIEASDQSPEENANDLQEEGRVYYVAVSRAKDSLHLVSHDAIGHFNSKSFDGGNRKRWHRWFKGGWNELEVGLDCDIDPCGFVRGDLHLDTRKVQEFLKQNQGRLKGSEVVLKKILLPGNRLRFLYTITVKVGVNEEFLLGRTTQTFTLDLLGALANGQSLPANIYNLKVNAVTTIVGPDTEMAIVPEPWKTSRLWLGVDIHGIGGFRAFWRKTKW